MHLKLSDALLDSNSWACKQASAAEHEEDDDSDQQVEDQAREGTGACRCRPAALVATT
jgi:hypothetical protein